MQSVKTFHVGCFNNFKQNVLPFILNVLALIGIVVHGAIYYNFLPERVAYHYDAYGNPDRTYPTRSFIAIYWVATCVSTVVMLTLSFVFSTNYCAQNCTSPEEATYAAEGRKYLRLVVSSWAMWLNLAVLAFIFTVFAILLENARKEFDSATTFGVYLPFFVFLAGLVVLVYWMVSNIQNAKGFMYAGLFDGESPDPQIETQPSEEPPRPVIPDEEMDQLSH